ncbi:MAG TPA: preprotein translocase subunit YajC [Candidatus Glassbacteria bacterium]|nr:preprotein translocase subunit YajC [Candidatus Glassbacteria bacterium]
MGVTELLAAAGGGGQAPQGGGLNMSFFLMIFATFAILYFLIMRPQQKQQRQHQEMLKNLKKGDEVVTAGGMYGTVIDLDEHSVNLKVAEGTKIKIERSKIGRVVTKSN